MFVKSFFQFSFHLAQQCALAAIRRSRRMAEMMLTAIVVLGGCAAQPSRDCANWHTIEFFENASLRDVKNCLAAGEDANATDELQRTPLMFAADRGKVDLALLLMHAGADVNAMSDQGFGPLYLAAGQAGWRPHLTTALLAAGADSMARNREGQTPLHVAVLAQPWQRLADPAVIDALLAAGADPNAKANQGETPLHYALAWDYHGPFVTRLLAAGANVSERDLMGSTPLHYAAGGLSLDAVTTLLAAGADVAARDRHHSTPLHRAAGANSTEAAAALLAAGADPNARDRFGATPLHRAATWHGDAAMILVLVDGGANVQAQDSSGATPLHRAVYWNNANVVATLLAAGAESSATDNFGDSVRDFAERRIPKNAEIIALL